MDKGYREDDQSCCYFHPNQVFVGVCPLCLYERLIILAAKKSRPRLNRRPSSASSSKIQLINLPKIFALGSLINRHHSFLKPEKEHNNDVDISPGQDDSFISIRFDQNNSVGAWEKGEVSKVSLDHCNSLTWNGNNNHSKSVVEQAKRSQGSSLRWRKRIGQVFQLIRWKRSNKVNVRHVGSSKIEGMKVGGNNNGWIRNLSKRKT